MGTGTGVLPRSLYPYGASFTGVDASEEQIAQARRLSREQGMKIDYHAALVEELDLPPASFDVITACQCFFYFDKGTLLPKMYDWLAPGGRFCELFMAWLPGESEIAFGTEAMVLRYNPHWSGGGFQRYNPREQSWLLLAKGLFRIVEAYGYDLPVRFTRESWHGRIMACRGIGASGLTREAVEAFDAEHTAWLQRCPEEFEIPHYATVLCMETTGGEAIGCSW